jgi:hypothetical protein
LLSGIKATDLDGTHQDVQRFRTLLVGMWPMPFYFGLELISRADKFGFQSGDIIMMLDNSTAEDAGHAKASYLS